MFHLNIKLPSQWPHILRLQLYLTAGTVGLLDSTPIFDTDILSWLFRVCVCNSLCR